MNCKNSIIAKNITFEAFAKFLEKVSKMPTSRKKLLELNKFFLFVRQKFKSHYGSLDSSKADGDSIYCVVRLLMPLQDRERAAYGLKAPTLGRVFYDILGVGANTEDAQKLLQFKQNEDDIGEFPMVVADVIRSRVSKPKNRPTLADLHSVLEKLEKHGHSDVTLAQQKRDLQKFVVNLTPLEGKWLSLILLRQLGLGVTTGQLFLCIHEKAAEYYSHHRNLETVCTALNDPHATLETGSVQLFMPFKQMLCARLNLLDIGTGRSDEDKRNTLSLPSPPFLIETKVDGERFEIHYDSSRSTDDQFRLFGRSGVDYTACFVETFTPRLRPQIKPGCQSFILDGEMMMFQRSTETFCQKGGRIDVRNLSPDDPDLQPAFVAFDVVYYNGEDLTGLIIEDRLAILDTKVFVPKNGVIVASKRIVARSVEQVEEALNEAVGRCEEGLIVKQLGTVYRVGKRVPTWLKIKPELVQSTMVEDLDLIILGGFYTKSFKLHGITRFLVGLLDDSRPAGQEVFYPLCTVGQGKVKQTEWRSLVKELEPNFIKRDNPSFKIIWKAGERPDVLINPKKSVVLQVKAAEIVWSDTYELSYTLRFARTIRIRRDKTWREIVTVKEFNDIRITTGGKLARRSDDLKKYPDKVEFYVPPLRSKAHEKEAYDEFNFTPPDEFDEFLQNNLSKPKGKVFEKKKRQPMLFPDSGCRSIKSAELQVLGSPALKKTASPHKKPFVKENSIVVERTSSSSNTGVDHPTGQNRSTLITPPPEDDDFVPAPPVNEKLPIPLLVNVQSTKGPCRIERQEPVPSPNASATSTNQEKVRKPQVRPLVKRRLVGGKSKLIETIPSKRSKAESIFQNRRYYLVGSEDWKLAIAKQIAEHGGSLAPTSAAEDLSAVVAESLSARARDLGVSRKIDILKPNWISKCVADGNVVEILPDDCWIAGEATSKRLSENHDVYGNSYSKLMTTVEMKQLLDKIMSTM